MIRLRPMISLDNFKQTPRDYQREAISRALATPREASLLLASPTGTGKGTIQLGLLRALLERGDVALIVTPSLEVLRGYLERCGAKPRDLEGSTTSLAKLGESIGVWTPVRLRNRIVKERLGRLPDTIIVDEAHHATDDTISGGELNSLLPGATWIGFTATPFRGTPEETEALRARWGEPQVVLTIPQAVENKSWALPTWEVVPLVDDDECGLRGGDVNADEVTLDSIEKLADLLLTRDLSKPTCVTVNSVLAAEKLREALQGERETRVVVGETPAQERAEAFEAVKGGGVLLVSVKVLGEGVDLPWLRRWVDASPTLSPVAFLQKLGRITRPNGTPPEYVGTNRNLERHGYLLQGALPREVVKAAQDAFGGPSERGGRAGLLKCVARAKPVPLPLLGGVWGTMWSFWEPSESGGRGYERVIMLDPTSERVISARHELLVGSWTKYERVPLPRGAGGMVSPKAIKGSATEPQAKWWGSQAGRFGLDPKVRPSKAQFLALPVLNSLNESMDRSGKVVPLNPPREAPARGAKGPEVQGDLFSPKKGEGPPPATPTGPRAPSPAPITRGYFTVVRPDGSRRTYRVRTMGRDAAFAPGKTVVDLLTGPDNTSSYTGVAFAGPEGLQVWKRHAERGEELRADWLAITGDKEGAGRRYAIHSSNCYICNRLLTTPESVARGIGPECAARGAPSPLPSL